VTTGDFPRTYVIRKGVDAGKVLIQWAADGDMLLVSPSGAVERRFRTPPGEVLWHTRAHRRGDVA